MPFRSSKFSIPYTPAILQQSIARHWKRRSFPKLRVRFLIALIFIIIAISLSYYWLIIPILIGCIFIAWKPLYTYQHIQQRVANTFAGIDILKIDMTPLNEHLCLFSQSGENRIAWETIKEVWCYPDTWILFTSPDHYITLPLEHLPIDVQDFIKERIQASGGVFR